MTWNDQQWLEMFQMKREIFYHIVAMLGPCIMRQDTNMHQTIPPDKRVAMVIMKLASPSSLHYIASQFGMATCMVRLATHEVCQLLKEITSNKIICLANLLQVIDGFNEKGFLNCVGALDSIHIPVLCPVGKWRAFRNCKGYASVILQAMVGHQGWFMNIYEGRLMQDAYMFRNSPLPGLVEKGHYAPSLEKTVIHGVAIPLVVVVDAAYPLKPWLMNPYGGNVTDPQKLVFNYSLTSCRMAMARAFG
ncbi:hypothetical protein Y1Q_0003080 [Alligator mississippiensis]|uniref:DDE Tnp4 domain-containing protein n=1 Tax=Alligator mississippiensis TaxID=8496 RepID=A0A151MDQ5_ALLMI|nr:hypothetical protein Y1Q_0003080 [Alligator mississippiensis]